MSTDRFADHIPSSTARLDILINNAEVVATPT